MTARTRRRFRVTLLALCCLLLAQWSMVTHACPVIARAGETLAQVQVEAEALADVIAVGGHDCHGAMAAATDAPAGGATLCVKHCADEGSLTGNALSVAAAAAAPPLVIRVSMPVASMPMRWQQASVRGAATAPPLSILYCISLT